MDRWEYLRPDHYPMKEELTKLGQQGWELVTLDPGTHNYIFKRKIIPSPTQTVQKPAPAKTFNPDDDFGLSF